MASETATTPVPMDTTVTASLEENAVSHSNQSDPEPEVNPQAEGSEQPAEEKKTKECPKYLDLAFAMDCTGSMGSYIHSAQQNIRKIVELIVSEEKADVRLALVQYRDHPPQDRSFVTKVNDFTPSVRNMKQWLDSCSASGGGDAPEAVADALHDVLKLSWREEATKVCVFIADAPPHGIGSHGDGFPNGCPSGLDPMQITNELASKHITLYMVGCEPAICTYRDFFMALAHLTGGQYVPLSSATLLAKVITGGVQEEISLQQLMEEVNQQVVFEFGARGEDKEIEEEALTKQVHSLLKKKGARAKQLQRNKAELGEASVFAQKMSCYSTMDEVRSDYASGKGPAVDLSSMAAFGAGPTIASRSAGKRHSRSRAAAAESAAPPPPPPGGSSFFGRLFGSQKASAPPPPPDAAFSAPAPMMTNSLAAEEDLYDCVEDDISEVQVQRMVQKSVLSNNLKTRYKKKY